MDRNGLRVVPGEAGGAAAEAIGPAPDPVAFQEECLRAFEVSQVARGFSETTVGNGAGTLQRFLAACGRPAWEVTAEDVDRVVGGLAAQGLAASTRRLYVQVFKNFHAFLVARKSAAIEAAFGVRLADPVDGFNAARHVGADSPAASPPPAPERLEEFFAFLWEARQRTQVRRRGPGLRAVPHVVSGRAAGRGGGDAGPVRCPFRPRPVRQAARAVL